MPRDISASDVLKCSFSAWFALFKGHTPKARIIKPLPREFIRYLQSDGVLLPDRGYEYLILFLIQS